MKQKLVLLLLVMTLTSTTSVIGICRIDNQPPESQVRNKRSDYSQENTGNDIGSDEPFARYVFNRIKKVFDIDELESQLANASAGVDMLPSDFIEETRLKSSTGVKNIETGPFLSQEEEYQLRVEYIKMQILQKLGLKEPPKSQVSKVFNTSSYEKFLELQALQKMAKRLQQPEREKNDELELMYIPSSKSTTHAASFNLTMSSQARKHPIKQILLHLNIEQTSDFFEREVNVSILWTNEINGHSREIILPPIRPMMRPVWEENSSKWTQYDLTMILVPDNDDKPRPPYMDADHLLITLENRLLKIDGSFVTVRFSNPPARRKREIDCKVQDQSRKNLCCREEFKVDFEEFGWSNWIIQPKSYDAYYCKGECNIATARYDHTNILISRHANRIKFCCSPNRMSSISIIYIDDSGNFFYKKMDNMVVQSCDCA